MRARIIAVAVLNAALAAGIVLLLQPAQPSRWLLAAIAVAAVSLLCWLPLFLQFARSIALLERATGEIASGHLEAQAPIAEAGELAALARNINEMAQQSHQMLRAQKRFLGDVAHELNAPIARVQFALGVIEETVDEARQADVKALHDEVQEMSSLVAELLSYSKAGLDAGTAPLKPVNLLQAVQRASDRESIPVEVAVNPAETALAHEVYLTRALGNLMRNARRYAGTAGPIEVRAQRNQGLVELIVADHGPGLPEAELDQVFEPFYRLDVARTRSTGGKGLGLAIVKSCIEVCRGQVLCRNRQPKGLEVVIRLAPGS